MLLTTTAGFEGYRIERYLGVIGGESVEALWRGNNNRVHETIQHAVNDLKRVAAEIGANAVVGVVIDHEVARSEGWGQSLTSVVAYGTAVVVVPTREPPPVLPPPAVDAEPEWR